MPYHPKLFLRATVPILAFGATASQVRAQAASPFARETMRATVRIVPALDAARFTLESPDAQAVDLAALTRQAVGLSSARRLVIPVVSDTPVSIDAETGAPELGAPPPLVRWLEVSTDAAGSVARQWIAVPY